MSTYWGYYCKTCSENSAHWFNHGEKLLAEFFEAKNLIEKCNFAFVEIYIQCDWASGDMHKFLDKHSGHDICLHSEYGNIKGFVTGGEK